jgi:hypothetical protein
MKHEHESNKPKFDIEQATSPRMMAVAVVVASAATMLLNALINDAPDASHPANANAPTHTTPNAPGYRAPQAIPTRNITQAEAKL